MEVKLSQRAAGIKPSPTLSIAAKAAELSARGEDIVSLAAGEPDFDTPEHARHAAIQAINDGFSKYTAVDGTPSLKAAVIEKFKTENDLHYEPDQILVSCGCKHSIYNLMQALLDAGDEVLIPAPYWVSYPDMAILAEGVPVFVNTTFEDQFKLTPAQLERAITPKTRLLIINSPSNPSGISYTHDELAALGAVLARHPQIVVASDDIYEHILWDNTPFKNIVNLCPELAERTVVLNGASKAYAMTGWRIGYAAGPKNLIRAMKNIQSQSTSNPTSIAQVAAEAALRGDQTALAENCRSFKKRHDFVLAELNQIDGVRCRPAQGTFYIFPDFNGVMDKAGIEDDIELTRLILEQGKVALVPGSAFGAPGCLRISFATSMEQLDRGLSRLQNIFSKE